MIILAVTPCLLTLEKTLAMLRSRAHGQLQSHRGVGEKCNLPSIPLTPNLWRGGPGIRDFGQLQEGPAPSSSRAVLFCPLLGTACLEALP